jgi:hypothetical protein
VAGVEGDGDIGVDWRNPGPIPLCRWKRARQGVTVLQATSRLHIHAIAPATVIPAVKASSSAACGRTTARQHRACIHWGTDRGRRQGYFFSNHYYFLGCKLRFDVFLFFLTVFSDLPVVLVGNFVFRRKRILGGLKAYLRATDHTSSNIISRDLLF